MNMILEHLKIPGTIIRLLLVAMLMFGVHTEVGIYTFLVILWLILQMETVALYVRTNTDYEPDDENPL